MGFLSRLASAGFFPMLISYMGSGGALLASSAAQLLTFAILARYLGVEQFGLYAVITAITNIGVQLCGLGAQESLIRRVAQDQSMFPTMLGHTYILSAASGVVFVAAGMVVLPLVAPVSPDLGTTLTASALILSANLILLKVISLSTQSFIAHSRFASANAIEIVFAVTRTGAAVLGCMVFGVSTIAEWAWWHFGAHLVVAILALWSIREYGKPRFTIVREEIRIGFLFSTQFLFKAIRGNADLLVLGAVASSEILGSYSVARRILESSYLSVEALNRLIYPGSAARAAGGVHHAYERTRKVAIASAAIATASAVVIFILSPFLPILFGEEYVSLPWITQAICWIVIPMGIYSTALEALGAAGLQGARATIWNTGNLLGTAIVGLATWLAGITGTLASYYLVEIAIAIAAWWVLLHYVGQHRARAALAE